VTRWGYTSADQVSWMIYPNGERLDYTYHPQGALDRVGQYVVGSQYDEAGRLELRYLGNVVQVDYEYYDWDEQGGRLSALKSGFPNIPTGVQNLEYNYDLNGNVAGILDTTNGATQTLSFGYDLLDRLISAVATGGQGTYNQSYSYDATTGNLASKAGVNYTYASPTHRHAVTATSNGKNFSYDANGNMTNHAGDTLTYNGENHLVQASVGGVATTYVYDGDAQQVLMKNGSETTIYIGKHFEVRISPSIQPPTLLQPPANPCLSGSVTCFYLPITPNGVTVSDPPAQREWRSYYYAGTTRVAVRVQGGVLPAGGKTFYLLGDHLGSTSVTLDEVGGKIGEMRFYPWGETRWESGAAQMAYKYTGQRLDSYINFYWYNSRWFDPYLNRWTSPDSVIPDYYNPLDWDRYAYVRNNPLKYNDPSGHFPACDRDDWACQHHWDEPVAQDWLMDDTETLGDVAIETILTTLVEPLDWWSMAEDCYNGECSPWMLLGLLPIIPGTVGNKVDEIIALLPAPQMQKHHIFPQDFRKLFEKVGINIDEHTVEVSQGVHLKGLHGKGSFVGPGNKMLPAKKWNNAWKEFFAQNPNPTAKEVYQFAGHLMDIYGLSSLPIVPYK
jgi:RHS repeat-associated protein